MKFSDRSYGNPFVIAEVGSNWKSIGDCLESIVKAKNSLADAVKFQLYTSEELYGFKDEDLKGELPRAWIPILADKAKAIDIEFMCSAFSPEGLDFINPFVNIHKLASSEMCHTGMLSKLCEFNKPILVSTGGQSEGDIRGVCEVLAGQDVTLLYCVAAYPARVIDLRVIGLMQETFKKDVGFSDHSTDVLCVPELAKLNGATVIEKHANFMDYRDTPDAPHSIAQAEFKKMVMSLRGDNQLVFGPTREEISMILKHKRRIVATKDIAQDEPLTLGENYGIFRSKIVDTRASHPTAAVSLNGQKAKAPIARGTGIWVEDVGP